MFCSFRKMIYGKNDFVKLSKNLARCTSEEIILLNHQSKYIGNLSMMRNSAKDILATSSNVLYYLIYNI